MYSPKTLHNSPVRARYGVSFVNLIFYCTVVNVTLHIIFGKINHVIERFCCIFLFMPPPLGARGILFLGCPSFRPSNHPSEIPCFHMYIESVAPPTNRYSFAACPSVHPERFPGISRRMHGGNGLQYGMLIYPDHLQKWLDCGLLIFLLLALFWVSETGQIQGFRAFPGQHMEGNVWNFVCWCFLTTFRTYKIMVTVYWFSSFGDFFDLP